MNIEPLKIKKRGEDGNKIISVRIKEDILSELDRIANQKDKSGCILEGIYAINPVTKKRVPIYTADFVLAKVKNQLTFDAIDIATMAVVSFVQGEKIDNVMQKYSK